MALSILLVIALFVVHGLAILDVQKLADEVEKLEEQALGYSKIQKHYDSRDYDMKPIDGPAMLKTITQNLNTKFEGLKTAAQKIQENVENNYNTFPSTIPSGMDECCNAKNVGNSLKFQSQVNLDGACVTEAATSPNDRKFPADTVQTVMKENYQSNPSLLWQYFGSEDGTSIYYPKVKVDRCTDYDPRFQQFYASAATTEPKDVVVVIDTSGSMATERNQASRLSIAKEAARTVVNTLNPDDRIGVVAYSDSAKTPTEASCYGDTLSIATTNNKNVMNSFINKLSTDHKSNFAAGLRKAFTYFKSSTKSKNGELRNRVILFLTDGTDYDGDDPLVVIRDENHLLNNSVVIMTYGIGQKETIDTNSLLRNMSKQIYNNPAYGNIRVGLTTYFEEETNLRSKMGAYYNYFKTQSVKPIFSVPFVDTFSRIGLIISVCFQVYDTKLLGVACTDVKLSDLFSEVTVFGEGEDSYVFIIDRSGRTLMHPLLPLSRTIKDNHPLLDINLLERANGAKEVINSMKIGGSGSKTFESTRTFARGVVINEGIQTKTLVSHYYWGPIANSDYSLCVVVGDGDQEQTLRSQTPTDDIFLYHLEKNVRKHCKNFKRRATKESSTVKFIPSAFKNPSRYLDRTETESDIRNYRNYFTGKGPNNSGFKAHVKNSVIASHYADDFWRDSSAIDKFVIWRYIGTKDGFVRVYPGVELLKDYDHEIRPWWRRTISQKGTLVLTTPYVDAWGAGYLMSMCKTVYKGSSTDHKSTDKIEAVLCADMPLTYIYHLLVDTNPTCKEDTYSCMLIDVSGFVVIHPDFVSPWIDDDQRFIKTVHIVSKDSDIANSLIEKGIMSRKSCIEFHNHKSQHTYVVRLPSNQQNGVNELNSKSGIQYELRPVAKTNLFLIIKKRREDKTICCKNLPMHAADVSKCVGSSCGCLCYKEIDVNICTNDVTLSDVGQTCIARTPDTTGSSPAEVVDGLPPCFDSECSTKSSELNCYKEAGCAWCVRNKAGNVYSNQCCKSKESCEFGIVPQSGDICAAPSTKDPNANKDNSPEDDTSGDESMMLPIVGGVLGAIVLILIITVIILLCRKRLLKRHPNPALDYLTPIPEVNRGMCGPMNQAFTVDDFPHPPPYTAQDGMQPSPCNTDSDRYNTLPSSNCSSTGHASIQENSL